MLPHRIYVAEVVGVHSRPNELEAADSLEELIGADDQEYTVGVYELKKRVRARRVTRLEEREVGDSLPLPSGP